MDAHSNRTRRRVEAEDFSTDNAPDRNLGSMAGLGLLLGTWLQGGPQHHSINIVVSPSDGSSPPETVEPCPPP